MGRVSDRQTIINLRADIVKLKADHLVHLQAMRKAERKRYAKITAKKRSEAKKLAKQEMRPLFRAKRKEVKEKIGVDVKKRVYNIVYKTVDRFKMRAGTVYMDGVLCFPVLLRFGNDYNMTPIELCTFIVANVIGEIRACDYDLYGITQVWAFKHLKSLTEKGYLEKFSGSGRSASIYSVSVKGRRLFLDFKKYYRIAVTENLNNEKGRVKRHEWPK